MPVADQSTHPSRSQTTATEGTSTEALPEHASNKPSDEEVAELNESTDDLLDEIDEVLDESAALRNRLKHFDEGLLDEIDAVLEEGLAKGFRQAGGQ